MSKHIIFELIFGIFCGEPLRLDLSFTNSLEDVTELIVLVERLSSVAVDKFGVVVKNV